MRLTFAALLVAPSLALAEGPPPATRLSPTDTANALSEMVQQALAREVQDKAIIAHLEAEKEKLGADLAKAQAQVQDLQARLDAAKPAREPAK